MHLFDAVRGPLAVEIMPFHHAGGAAALARADHVDRFDLGEDVDLQFLADLQAIDSTAELANETLRFAIGLWHGLDAGGGTAPLPFAVEFGDLTASGAAGKTAGLIEIAQLNGLVAVFLLCPQLKDAAGASLDHRCRDHLAGLIKNLCHPDLAAEQSNYHRSLPLCYAARREPPTLSRVYPHELPFHKNVADS